MLVALLAGCTAGPVPGASSSASPVASPSSTSGQEKTALIPFDGDCARVATDEQVGAILGTPVRSDTTSTIAHPVESVALLGGLDCIWFEPGSAYLRLDLFPVGVVPTEVAADAAALACGGSNVCGRAETIGSTWVKAAVTRDGASDTEPAGAERARITAQLEAVFALVRAASADTLAARPAEREAAWWTIPACAALQDAVIAGTGDPDLRPGYPTDAVPSGVAWDIAVSAGVVQWCPWYAVGADQGLRAVELDIQPGVGSPTDAGLAGALPSRVEGADHAWWIGSGSDGRKPEVVAVSGPNRLTVRGVPASSRNALIRTTTAVLARLNG